MHRGGVLERGSTTCSTTTTKQPAHCLDQVVESITLFELLAGYFVSLLSFLPVTRYYRPLSSPSLLLFLSLNVEPSTNWWSVFTLPSSEPYTHADYLSVFVTFHVCSYTVLDLSFLLLSFSLPFYITTSADFSVAIDFLYSEWCSILTVQCYITGAFFHRLNLPYSPCNSF